MKMVKKTIPSIILAVVLIISASCLQVFAANTEPGSPGPAPSSGDGVSEGSGFDREFWPNDDSPGIGPAPNSGDGEPDGSGF